MPIPFENRPGVRAGPYRKLINALSLRAARMGSRDPEAAAQEAMRRSLADAVARPAVDYYFGDAASDTAGPQWSLLQLLGWLHGVLRFVVREERARAAHRRETTVPPDDLVAHVDPRPGQLESAIDAEQRTMVRDSLSRLAGNYRSALVLRLSGAKYDEIARRLGVNENTVATWLRRGSSELVRDVQARIVRCDGAPGSPSRVAVKVSHA